MRRRARVERIVLRLGPGAGTLVVPVPVALSDQPPRARGACCRDQDVGAFGSKPVRQRKRRVEVLVAGLARETGHLVDDDLGTGASHGLHHSGSIEAVGDGGLGLRGADGGGLVGRARHRGHGVAARDQERHEPFADGAGAAGDEDPHGVGN